MYQMSKVGFDISVALKLKRGRSRNAFRNKASP